MRIHRAKRFLSISLSALFLLTSVALGQEPQEPKTSSSQSSPSFDRPGIRQVTTSQKTKLKGRIIRRDADTFSVRDNQDMEVIVRLTDNTSVKSNGGFFRRGKNYDVT